MPSATETEAAASSELEHPLEVGTVASCLREPADTTPCAIEVIERREEPDGSWCYYVHFEGTDRRLDDWVRAAQLVAAPAPPPPSGGRAGRAGGRGAGGPPAGADGFGSRRATRNMKRKIDVTNNIQSVADEALEKEHEESTKVKNIKVIEMGTYEIDAWYFSPYPDAFAQQERLFICPYSLKYFKKRSAYVRHLAGVQRKGPPGTCIYRAPAPPLSAACIKLQLAQAHKLTLYEVDGSSAKVYCQCLCLLAKLFLDHKTLYYDVDPFLFYVLCEEDEEGESTLAVRIAATLAFAIAATLALALALSPWSLSVASDAPGTLSSRAGLLLEGKVLSREQQHRLHPRASAAPAQGLRQAAHRPSVQPDDARGQAGIAREAALRFGPALLPLVLDRGAARRAPFAQGQPLHPRHCRAHGDTDGGHHRHAPVAQPDQILEGPACDLRLPQDCRRASARQRAPLLALRRLAAHMATSQGARRRRRVTTRRRLR